MATKRTPSKSQPAKSAKRSATPPSRRWSAKVNTDSTKPDPGLFKESAEAIADGLAKKRVSPKGPAQGMQMLSFYENRAGKNLSAERKRTLEHAKDLLRAKESKAPAKKSTARKSAKKSSTSASSGKQSSNRKAGKG